MTAVHDVERLGSLAQVGQKRLAGDADPAGLLFGAEDVSEILVRELQDDDQLVFDDLDALHRQDKRVPNRLDALDGTQLLLGGGVAIQRIGTALNEFNRLEQAARRLALPHLAEAATAQRLNQAITGNRLGIRAVAIVSAG